MKQNGRYILLNRNGVMWQRRWFWKFFQNYENYDNGLNKQREKVNKKLAELQEEVDKLQTLESKKRAIIQRIQTARGCDKDCGPDEQRSFSFFSYFRFYLKDRPPAPLNYVDIVRFFKGKGATTAAINAASELGLQVKSVGGYDLDSAGDEQTASPYAIDSRTVTVRSQPIVPQSNNQQKKQRGQQQQN